MKTVKGEEESQRRERESEVMKRVRGEEDCQS